MLQVKNKDEDFGWGVVVNFQKKVDQSTVCFYCQSLPVFSSSCSVCYVLAFCPSPSLSLVFQTVYRIIVM